MARVAGVSRTTVSHSLNGRGYVDARTRARVKQVAVDLGYHPNLRAQRLRTGAAQAIALVSSMPFAVAGGPSRLAFFMEIAAAAAETALTRGYPLVLVPPLERSPMLDQLDVDGAVVVEPAENDAMTQQLTDRGLKIVTIGRQPGRHDLIPYVDLDTATTARLLLNHLFDRGARRIALLTGIARRHSYVDFEPVYAEFVLQRGLPLILTRADERMGEEAGWRATADLLEEHPGIDGLCAAVDAFAVGGLRALNERGRRVPQDVLVATRYDGPRARTSTPPLTAVDLHLDRLGDSAVGLLLEHLAGGAAPHVVPGPGVELVPRQSSDPREVFGQHLPLAGSSHRL
ncbi:MAG: substrate-binding domain-containing protein [Chloroflexota bacterium]